jgi:hypothetical protein
MPCTTASDRSFLQAVTWWYNTVRKRPGCARTGRLHTSCVRIGRQQVQGLLGRVQSLQGLQGHFVVSSSCAEFT